MLLAIDIGNTNVVVGLLENGAVRYRWRLDSHARRTEDEWFLLLRTLFRNDDIPLSAINGVVISSVVPGLTPFFRKLASDKLGVEPLIVSGETDTGMAIRYDDVRAVGADRICNAVAGFERYGGPLIILDFGTATTFDVINSDGDYIGGVIAPGIETAALHLHDRAARLPSVELKFPERIIARNTEESMQAGIMFGTLDSAAGIVARIEEEIGEKCTVISTGGIGGMIHKKLACIVAFEPDLTLFGMEIIHNRNAREHKAGEQHS